MIVRLRELFLTDMTDDLEREEEKLDIFPLLSLKVHQKQMWTDLLPIKVETVLFMLRVSIH